MSWVTKPADQAGQAAALAGREMCALSEQSTGNFWALAPHSRNWAAFHFRETAITHQLHFCLHWVQSVGSFLLHFLLCFNWHPVKERLCCPWPTWVEISKGFNLKGQIWHLQNSKHITANYCSRADRNWSKKGETITIFRGLLWDYRNVWVLLNMWQSCLCLTSFHFQLKKWSLFFPFYLFSVLPVGKEIKLASVADNSPALGGKLSIILIL